MSSDPYLQYLERPNRSPFARFVVAYMSPVARLARRVVGCPERSDDVAQEVFVRLSRLRPSLRDVPNPRAYVLRTALNTARRHLRREAARSRHEQRAAELRTRASRSVEDEAISREAVQRLHECIDSLPDSLRVAIHLRAVEGLSYREIAEITGASVGTVSMRIRRARRKLEQSMGHSVYIQSLVEVGRARRAGWYPEEAGEISPELAKRLAKLSDSKTIPLKGVVLGLIATAASLIFLGAPLFDTGETSLGTKTSSRTRKTTDHTPTSSVAAPSSPPARTAVAATRHRSRARIAEASRVPDRSEFERRESTGENPDGDRTVKRSANVLFPAVVALGVLPALGAAETGDVDGDGRLTIADVLYLEDGREPAEGSLAGFEEFPCYHHPDLPTYWLESIVPSSIYLESLRRGVDGALAHWDSVWPEDVVAEQLPQDGRCEIELLPSTAAGGSNDRARLHMNLSVLAPVRSFSVVLEGPPGLLEAPPGGFDGFGPSWNEVRWRRKEEVLVGVEHFHRFGDLPVAVTTHAYLITGGRYVVTYDLTDNEVFDDIQPGEYLVTIEARLALHTPAGRYPIRVLPASEILFRDGTVRRPVVLTDGELTIESDVTEGLDDGVPPLELDRENREVLGKIEFRLVDGEGNPPEPGEPVVEAMNDEEVKVRLQLRTEVPLNKIRYYLRWRTADGLDLECESPPPVVFARPDGEEYEPFDTTGVGRNHCGTIHGIGEAAAIFQLAGAGNTPSANNRPDRPLEYFRPLGEWLDIVELSLSVPDEAVGGTEIPLAFRPAHFRTDMAAFTPYNGVYPCNPDRWPEDDTYWKYSVIYHDTFIRVHGDDKEPPPPPDLGIRFVLGTVSGAPGELVEVPIHAASSEVLSRMRLALELDPAILSVEGVELDVLDERTDSIVQERIGRPGTLLYWVCIDEDGDGVEESCNSGVPSLAWLRDTDRSFVLLDLLPSPWRADGRLVEIGRLRLRIAEDARPGETILAPARVPWKEGGFEVLIESGGNLEDVETGGPYSPATEVVPGTVVIEDGSPRRDLVRGDANVDGRIDISDAVLMLSSLFADRGPLGCEDAADADDNGTLNITDPILLLGVLFGGGGELPPPAVCAPDPTADALGCAEGCSAG